MVEAARVAPRPRCRARCPSERPRLAAAAMRRPWNTRSWRHLNWTLLARAAAPAAAAAAVLGLEATVILVVVVGVVVAARVMGVPPSLAP